MSGGTVRILKNGIAIETFSRHIGKSVTSYYSYADIESIEYSCPKERPGSEDIVTIYPRSKWGIFDYHEIKSNFSVTVDGEYVKISSENQMANLYNHLTLHNLINHYNKD